MSFSVVVQLGKDAHEVHLEQDSTVAQLQSALEDLVGIITRKQKLIHKGKVLQPHQTLRDASIKNGGKVLLLGSSDVQSRVS